MLGLFSSLSCVLILVPDGGATLLIFLQNMLSFATGGKAKLIGMDLAKEIGRDINARSVGSYTEKVDLF